MTNMSRRGGGALLVFSLAWLTICAGCGTPAITVGQRPATAKKDVLRVGVSETAPPLIFTQDDKPAGIEADLARQLAETLGRKVQFVSIYWPDLIPELRDRRIDIIMAGMSVTDRRAGRVAFTEPYMLVGQRAMIRAEDEETLDTVGAVRVTSRRVGVEKGSTGESLARTELPRAEVFALPTLEEAVNALRKGQVDVVIHDSPSIQWMVANSKDDKLLVVQGRLSTESLAWAVAKDNTQLLNAANGALAEWKESGKLQEIIEKWLPQPH